MQHCTRITMNNFATTLLFRVPLGFNGNFSALLRDINSSNQGLTGIQAVQGGKFVDLLWYTTTSQGKRPQYWRDTPQFSTTGTKVHLRVMLQFHWMFRYGTGKRHTTVRQSDQGPAAKTQNNRIRKPGKWLPSPNFHQTSKTATINKKKYTKGVTAGNI